MKILNFIKKECILVLLLSFTFTNCSKEFLEEPKNTEGIVVDAVFANRELVEIYYSGILHHFKDVYNQSNVSTGGLYSFYFARSIKGNDLIQSNGWFTGDYAHTGRGQNQVRSDFTWTRSYDLINLANVLIDGVEKSDLDTDSKKEFIAAGKTIRAFHYFQLALEFAPNYTNDKSVAKLPIYTEPTVGTSEPKGPSPLSDVFDLILSDLNDAIADLPDTRPLGKTYINKDVARAILTRVLQVTQDDWARTSELAKLVYGGDAATAVVSASFGNGFRDLEDDEWIWGMFQDEDESIFWWSVPHGLTDHGAGGFYKSTYVNPNFVALFSVTDERNLYEDIYNSSTPWREFVTTKFDFDFYEDFPILRKSEMVLIDAEAQYNMGNETGAHDLLFALQKQRDPNAVKSSNTAAALMEEILVERRKELFGETGVEWFDAKRLNRPLNRDAVHRVPVNVPANSELFYLEVPESEINANPNIDASINN